MSSNTSVADILERAADLIEPEGRWTQGALSRDADGNDTTAGEDTNSVCWCAAGAIYEVPSDIVAQCRACDVLRKAIGGGSLGGWNDAPERTQAEVVAKLREAAAKAREQDKCP